ncbi:MAG TPA: ABC transporter permease [Thermoanaerobaculia bacterium]|nr:ABC transporter permease [Thermoanaerobaculia bacterium]
MSVREAAARWRGRLARRRNREQDLELELRAHLDLEAEEQEAAGASPEGARQAALRALGSPVLVKERVRESWGWTWLDRLRQDLRLALRQLRRSPGFTVAAIVTLALGLGANTAIFTLINRVLLSPLPVPRPSELYSLGDNRNCCVTTGIQDSFTLVSSVVYEQLRDHTPEFSALAAFESQENLYSFRRGGAAAAPEPARGEFVSGNYFAMFGGRPAAGRLLAADDDRAGAPPAAVMSYRCWAERYARDPAVVGGSFVLEGLPVTVVGVAPPGFFGDTLRTDPPDLWLPTAAELQLHGDVSLRRHPEEFWLYVVGRLRPGTRPAAAAAHVATQVRQWLFAHAAPTARERAQIGRMRVELQPAAGGVGLLRDSYGAGLGVLMAVSGLLLLIGCANVANLLLARATAARRQTAVRVALGAGRGRLIRQTLTEGVLLALLGGAAGLGVALAATRIMLALAFRGAGYVPIDPNPSLPALAFGFVLALLTGVVFSATPAWLASHVHPAEPLRGAGRSTRDRSALPQRSLLVVQAALSLVLLVGAGLLTESLGRLENQRFGFATRHRLMLDVDLALGAATPERLRALYQALARRLTRIPGVVSASLALYSPFEGVNWSDAICIEGIPGRIPAREDERAPSIDRVSPHYFETVGTRLLRGRAIDERDTPASHHVVVINETFARKYFPNRDPLGRHMGMGGDPRHAADYEIVGIVEDAKYTNARVPAYATEFIPLLQDQVYDEPAMITMQARSNLVHSIQLRLAGPLDVQAAVRRAIAEADPDASVLGAVSFDERVRRAFNADRLIARLTELYGLLALVLASVGLYGVAAYTLARRTPEIGIRVALGAAPWNVVLMVLRGALAPIALGLAIGIPAALAAGQALASRLFGVEPYEPHVFLVALLVLAGAAFAAAIVPARRTTAIDPIHALRAE